MIPTVEQLEQQARELALIHLPARASMKASDRVKREFRQDMSALGAFAAELKQADSSAFQPAEQWLTDHADFIESEAFAVEDGFSQKFARRLIRLKPDGDLRALDICHEYIRKTDGAFDMDSFTRYINAYQDVSTLTIAEIWAMPFMLKIAAIRRLSLLMGEVRERRQACLKVEALLAPFAEGKKSPDAAAITEALEQAGEQMPLPAAVIVHLASQLNEWADEAGEVREWLLCRLDNGAESLNKLVLYEHQLQASFEVTAGQLVQTLRMLTRSNWTAPFEQMSIVERTLREEQAATYSAMDERSRQTLRGRVERLAARYGVPEAMIAEQAVKLARDGQLAYEAGEQQGEGGLPPRQAYAAYYLLDPAGIVNLKASLRECSVPGRLRGEVKLLPGITAYLNWTVALFAVLLAAGAWAAAAAHQGPMGVIAWCAAIVTLALPVSDWAVTVMHESICRLFESNPLLRYDYARGIDADAATITVIPVIWSKAEDVLDTADRLELHYLANKDPNISFAILGDFADAASEVADSDEEIRQTAVNRIHELNRIYGNAEAGTGPFLLFQRKRVWNESEGAWIGWERKRGKLVEFVELLRGGENTSYDCTAGDCSSLNRFRYVITLDADTELPVGAAQRMIATMHLPYNRARLNETGTRVAEGYGVLQPRVGVSYQAVSRSRLARLWSGRPGIDPYAFAMSDPYQDAFGQGIFTGKGIFDINAFRQVLSRRIPENRVLSHDLLEGGFLRGGLLTDIEVVDGHPATFQSYQQRMHRWARGDWQLVLWLRSRMEDRDGNRQKVDLGGLTRYQIVDNLRRSLMPIGIFALLAAGTFIGGGAGIVLFAIGLATLAMPFIRTLFDIRRVMRKPGTLLTALGQSLISLVMLPYQAFLMADAALRTLYRISLTKKKLLEWTSSAEVERNGRTNRHSLLFYWQGLAATVLFSIIAGLYGSGIALAAGLAAAVLWLLAPAFASWLDGSPAAEYGSELSHDEQLHLKQLAAQIWAYYEDFAVEGEHWLPPDNVQIDPAVGVAHRTSPTNIGLMMACTVTARDFGFIETEGMLDRIERTLSTIEQMDKWSGHLYNWYDTQTLRPLPPLYVSTVDSGNFVAYLVAVRHGIVEWARRDSDAETESGKRLAARAEAIAARLEAVIQATDFRPLYDEAAGLFTLGYHAALDRRETILYDLLASEARQASFLAIAFGQVPASHWFKLGRTMTKSGRFNTLLSWSGTMFEFLMPALLMRTYRKTVWSSTYRGVVNRQIQYAQQRGVPFGISESGYYAFDYQMNYQYRAFGVPGLGFQRGLENDLVLAPYAAVMALAVDARQSIQSLNQMEKLGAKGKYGYYEAIDFTDGRLPAGEKCVIISSFMAHHLGMSLLTLGNVLLPFTMIDRFHADKRVQAAELLLQERVPEKPAIIKNGYKPIPAREADKAAGGSRIPLREFDKPAPQPEVCVLSNGSFTSVISDVGGGYTSSGGIALSRWHEDPVAEAPGSCFYIRDVAAGKVWSPSYEPCRTPADRQKVRFALDKASFERLDGQMETMLEICVPPEHKAELRRLTLTNTGSETRIIEVTGYMELALAPPAADEAHPAFSKLFVKTEYDAASESLLAVRRPRTSKEPPIWAAYSMSVGCESLGPPEYETDRAGFIGRGHTLASPASLECKLSGTVGAVLDPSFVMRRRLSVAPGESVQLYAVAGIAASREEALAITAGVCGERQAEHAFQLAWTHSRIDLRHQHLTALEASDFHALAGRLLYQSPLKNERAASIAANKSGQSGLWPLGISGDLPIAAVYIADQSQLAFATKVLTGHAYLRRKGIRFDLLFMIEEAAGYYHHLQDAIRKASEQTGDGSTGPGAVFFVNADSMTEEQRHLLTAVCRVSLRADGPSLRAQLGAGGRRKPADAAAGAEPAAVEAASAAGAAADEGEAAGGRTQRQDTPAAADNKADSALPTIEGLPPSFRLLPEKKRTAAELPASFKPDSLLIYNGWGGFAEDGREYRIAMHGGKYLTAPWSNVIANPTFGTLVTELGTGYTWWRNSREFKLTPWSNDPVLDTPGEICYIRDETNGRIWSGAPAPDLGDEAYEVSHGFGYTRFNRRTNGFAQQMTVYVDKDEPVKFVLLELHNETDEERELSVAYYTNWVLGVRRQGNAPYIVSEWDEETGTLLARNSYQETFRDGTAFLHVLADEPQPRLSYTANRHEFIGRGSSIARPSGMEADELSGATGAYADSCGAVRLKVNVAPGETRKVAVLLGASGSSEQALALVRKYGSIAGCEQALAEMRSFWDETLGQIQVATPSKELDLMLNGWLLYQALSCRIWARTGFYQAGGAYGFRDQLQDSLSLLHARPELTRKQIVLHASHQYEEGDVQHWWHEETERGIRTKYSDDLLWLPYAVARYIKHTGDSSVLEERVPYLTSPVLTEEEHERYEATTLSAHTGTVYEHAIRAIEKASRYGEHGMPLMGIGDWNDGMNSVGDEGRGESVWLGWFLCDVLRKFSEVCELKGDAGRAQEYRERRDTIAEAVNRSAWDGEWFRRAVTDEGAWLGSYRNEECRVDAIAQSWSVISGAAPLERARQAMRSFDRELVDRELSVARLLTPAFDKTDPSPGYIQGYPPGIRENGAQYTHGVIWSIVAWAELGEGDKAAELFQLLNPINHAHSAGDVRKYAGEPYVMAADVYTGEPYKGRAGWTWYTGASGWMYQAGIEWLLGIRREQDKLTVNPAVPAGWEHYSFRYRYGRSVYEVKVTLRGASAQVLLDGAAVSHEAGGLYIPLKDDGQTHQAEWIIPHPALTAAAPAAAGKREDQASVPAR
ncbi:GH36-type glycosyl hydrolase domain-containing protein [Paenibacillus protaetiae]|uniref:Glycosyl transferase family 36 n=1 Tax=Paenibacillus protaetiae TaxID=2509456 RepID=A0A4P6EQU3_9BACL|nr:glucoamylase family protein [Paenibacillus protaetiae]QAY65224.1 glycosyl transferase family 36 [Paenibacillus protaetiae]